MLKELYKALIEAISGFKKEYIDGFSTTTLTSPINLDVFKRLPPFITNVRFSALNQLRSESIFNLRDLVYLYRPYAFNPAEIIPPFTMHGEISDGSHMFTFDGRHMTFPGKCNYILTRDFVEGNFSVVAHMENGKMKTISLTDKKGYLEINDSGELRAAEKKVEYPYHHNTIHAWRNYYTVSMLSEFGVEVQCTEDLKTCHIKVSGFYSGKLRGLLGNGNNEPYDDYLLPSGKITESTSDLGNAYRVKSNCDAVVESGDNHPKSHSNEFCAQYFGRDSSLRMCFIFVNPTNYREACEHATHDNFEDSQKSACSIAFTYASRCRDEHIPVSIPKACSRCTVGDKPLDVGDEVAVRVPQKHADIVVVFDTSVDKQIIQDVISELRRELKTNGIADLRVASIGYNMDDKYLYQHTTNGKLDFNDNFTKTKSSGPKEEKVLVTGQPELDAALAEFEKARKQTTEDLGLSADARAFQRAMKYPFRATATKTILAFRSDGIPYSTNPVGTVKFAKTCFTWNPSF